MKSILYLNGTQKLNTNDDGAPNVNSEKLEIGTCSADPSNKNVDGIIDEVRVSGTARSAGWIKTSYNNQNNPGTGEGGFLSSIGSEFTPVPQQPVPELSTLLLFSIGLVTLAGYLYARTRS